MMFWCIGGLAFFFVVQHTALHLHILFSRNKFNIHQIYFSRYNGRAYLLVLIKQCAFLQFFHPFTVLFSRFCIIQGGTNFVCPRGRKGKNVRPKSPIVACPAREVRSGPLNPAKRKIAVGQD